LNPKVSVLRAPDWPPIPGIPASDESVLTAGEYKDTGSPYRSMTESETALIQREVEHHQAGREAHLILKMNSLIDKKMIKELYRASQAGLKIDLLVRGICGLRPGLEGISENIRVISIVGRFLEHSRIYYFRNGGDEEVYLGSADLMPRNINRRVEVLFPVQDPRLIAYLYNEVLQTELADNVKARKMLPDGTYERIKQASKDKPLNSQAWLINWHQQAN
jgi:polyphosphate kinase